MVQSERTNKVGSVQHHEGSQDSGSLKSLTVFTTPLSLSYPITSLVDLARSLRVEPDRFHRVKYSEFKPVLVALRGDHRVLNILIGEFRPFKGHLEIREMN